MPSTLHHGELVPAPPPDPNGAGRYPTSAPSVEDGAPAAPTMTLRDFFEVLRRRAQIALSVFVLVMALGLAITLITKPVYRTGARLLVEGKSNTINLSTGDDPLSSVFAPKSGRDVDTQVEILRSPMVLDRVVKEAGVPPTAVNLDVQRVERTDVIELVAISTSREGLARFIDILPKVYKDQSRSDRLREVTASLDFAQKTLARQNAKLQATERALANFRTRARVANTSDETSSAIAQIAQTRTGLAAAQQEAARLTAQVAALQTERRQLGNFTDTPVTTTNPQVQALKDQIASLGQERQQKLFLYKPNDDEIKKVDLQISSLRQRLANTPATITNSSRAPNPAVSSLDEKIRDARAALQAARDSQTPLRRQLAAQSATLSRFPGIARQEARLSRDLDNSRLAYDTFYKNVMQLSTRKAALEAAGAPVVILQGGSPPVKIAPSLVRNLLFSLLLASLLGAGAALLQESLDDHIRNAEEARRLLGTSILGYFPLLTGVAKGARPVLDLENPDKTLLEGFRGLRSNVQFALVNSPGQKLLVTSSIPGEGKSYIASNLAIAMALAGKTVILVDTDLHRPRQHEIFGVPRVPGLTDALVGNAKLRDCVQEVGVPGMRLIAAGVMPPNPAELLNSAVMDAVIQRLGKGADVVIFDSPPLLATADSQVLASKVDGVIYVMQLGRVPRSAVKRSFELLRQAHARVVGMVFNQIDQQTNKAYGGYGGYYYDDDPTNPPAESESLPAANVTGGGDGNGPLLTRARRFSPTATAAPPQGANGTGPHDDGDEDDDE